MLSFARALPRTVALTRPAAAIGQTALRSATCSVRCFERAAPQPSTAPLAKFAALQVSFLWINEVSSGADDACWRCVDILLVHLQWKGLVAAFTRPIACRVPPMVAAGMHESEVYR